MQLKSLRGKTGYIETYHALIPFYQLSQHELLLFDSGLETDGELLEMLDQKQLRVRAVLCTHLHEDHTGNNAALVERHGAKIFVHAAELSAPKVWQTPAYPVTVVEGVEPQLDLDGVTIRGLYTPGHSYGHLAYITPDDVCYFGDAMISRRILQHSKMPFMEDVDRSIVSMEAIRQTRYPLYIAAHKGTVTQEELPGLVEQNIQKELELYALLRQVILKPAPMDQVITDYIRAAGVLNEKVQEKVYVRYTAKARILALAKIGEFSIEDELVIPREAR